MNESNLRIYIKNVYNLEVSLYGQNKLYGQISAMVQNLENVSDDPMESTWSISSCFDKYEFLGLSGILGAIGTFIGMVIGMFISGGRIYLSVLCDWVIRCFLGGILLSVLINIIKIMVTFFKIKAENKEIDKKNKEIRQYNIERENYNQKQITILNAELHKIKNYYLKTKETLNLYYSKNIIYPKYRNLVAISSFYEYFTSGRCSKLEGHEGAYNIFENEIRLNRIMGKLDDVIAHLEQIQDNQYTLYTAIHEGNKKIDMLSKEIQKTTDKLDSIDKNTKLMAYYEGIAARNSEFLTWLHIVNVY